MLYKITTVYPSGRKNETDLTNRFDDLALILIEFGNINREK